MAPPSAVQSLTSLECRADVELALSATAHPEIGCFGRALGDGLDLANGLLERVLSWQAAGDFPPEVHQNLLGELHALQKGLERLDCLELESLQAEWGDKATVRAARKQLITVADVVMARLEALQREMSAPARWRREEVQRERQAARADTDAPGNNERPATLQDKYGEALGGKRPLPEAEEPPAKRARRPGVSPAGVLFALLGVAEVERPKSLGSCAADLEARVLRLRAQIEAPSPKRSLGKFSRHLARLAASPTLSTSSALCCEAVECAVAALAAAVERSAAADKGPAKKALGRLLTLTVRLEGLRDPKALHDFLSDLATAVKCC